MLPGTFEFSNEAYNGAGWAGGATAQQYASALNDWIPALRQIKPDILISMDGVKDHGTVGDFEPWYISPQPLWYQTVSAAFLMWHQLYIAMHSALDVCLRVSSMHVCSALQMDVVA